jgi:hypothetical protein
MSSDDDDGITCGLQHLLKSRTKLVEGFLFLENVGIFLFMEKKNLLPISE